MTTTLNVDGMTCDGCVGNVRGLLANVAGVTAVEVTLSPGQAVVEHGDQVAADQLIGVVVDAGFEARVP